jgi:hypothetical protein
MHHLVTLFVFFFLGITCELVVEIVSPNQVVSLDIFAGTAFIIQAIAVVAIS